jgi:Ser/Thr protein kinase RdoA (MazF antagonist)
MGADQGESPSIEQTIVDNEVFDLLRATAAKLEGLAAYNKYDRDGQANRPVWRELRQHDEQAVRQLLQQLEKFAKAGKLTAK